MNIGYLLFMALLCATLVLWAIVAIRDDGQGVGDDEEESAEDLPSGEAEVDMEDEFDVERD